MASTLGIDIGSHRTRVCIWVGPNDSDSKVVENLKSTKLDDGNHFPGDFSSRIYPFDHPSKALYLADRVDFGRRSISAKYGFYALANASDILLEEYPSVRDLTARKNDPAFRLQLKRAMQALLSRLRDRVTVTCKEEGYNITRIGLTIPVQWTLDFETVYRDLVSSVFSMDGKNIFFFTESEALARYLFKFYGERLDKHHQYKSMMFADFGGHNMVSYPPSSLRENNAAFSPIPSLPFFRSPLLANYGGDAAFHIRLCYGEHGYFQSSPVFLSCTNAF